MDTLLSQLKSCSPLSKESVYLRLFDVLEASVEGSSMGLYDKYAKEYAASYLPTNSFWMRWLSLKLGFQAKDDRDPFEIKTELCSLFQMALKACPSPNIAMQYIRYLVNAVDSNLCVSSELDAGFEFVKELGLDDDILYGNEILVEIEEYIETELGIVQDALKSDASESMLSDEDGAYQLAEYNKLRNRLVNVYDYHFKKPLLNLETSLKSFEAVIEDYFDNEADLLKVCDPSKLDTTIRASIAKRTERENMEVEVSNSFVDDTVSATEVVRVQQLSLEIQKWKTYIEFEAQQQEYNRVFRLYERLVDRMNGYLHTYLFEQTTIVDNDNESERSVIDCNKSNANVQEVVVSVWLEYIYFVFFQDGVITDNDHKTEITSKAIKMCPQSLVLWEYYLECMYVAVQAFNGESRNTMTTSKLMPIVQKQENMLSNDARLALLKHCCSFDRGYMLGVLSLECTTYTEEFFTDALLRVEIFATSMRAIEDKLLASSQAKTWTQGWISYAQYRILQQQGAISRTLTHLSGLCQEMLSSTAAPTTAMETTESNDNQEIHSREKEWLTRIQYEINTADYNAKNEVYMLMSRLMTNFNKDIDAIILYVNYMTSLGYLDEARQVILSADAVVEEEDKGILHEVLILYEREHGSNESLLNAKKLALLGSRSMARIEIPYDTNEGRGSTSNYRAGHDQQHIHALLQVSSSGNEKKGGKRERFSSLSHADPQHPAKKSRKVRSNSTSEVSVRTAVDKSFNPNSALSEDTVHISNLNFKASETDINAFLSTVLSQLQQPNGNGQPFAIQESFMPLSYSGRPTGSFYLKFNTKDACSAFIQKHESREGPLCLMERPIKVERAGCKFDIITMKNAPPNLTILVNNLPLEWNIDAILDFFDVCGDILAIKLVNDKKSKQYKGTAMLQFCTLNGRQRALTLNKLYIKAPEGSAQLECFMSKYSIRESVTEEEKEGPIRRQRDGAEGVLQSYFDESQKFVPKENKGGKEKKEQEGKKLESTQKSTQKPRLALMFKPRSVK
jgi:RNA recognition motif-containing protein